MNWNDEQAQRLANITGRKVCLVEYTRLPSTEMPELTAEGLRKDMEDYFSCIGRTETFSPEKPLPAPPRQRSNRMENSKASRAKLAAILSLTQGASGKTEHVIDARDIQPPIYKIDPVKPKGRGETGSKRRRRHRGIGW